MLENASTTPISAAAWRAALNAVDAAPAGARDDALTALMAIEATIEEQPVQTIADAALRLNIALGMSGRKSEDIEPEWVLVSDALAFLDRSSAD